MFYEITFKGIVCGNKYTVIEPITVNAYVNGGYSINYDVFEKYYSSDFFIKLNDELVYAYSENPLSLHILESTTTIYGLKKPPLFGEAALI